MAEQQKLLLCLVKRILLHIVRLHRIMAMQNGHILYLCGLCVAQSLRKTGNKLDLASGLNYGPVDIQPLPAGSVFLVSSEDTGGLFF